MAQILSKKVLQSTDLNFPGNVIAVKLLDLGGSMCDHGQELFTQTDSSVQSSSVLVYCPQIQFGYNERKDIEIVLQMYDIYKNI